MKHTTKEPKTNLHALFCVKAGDKLMHNGCVFTATDDACVDNEGSWYVDVVSKDSPERCLYDTDFEGGNVKIIVVEPKRPSACKPVIRIAARVATKAPEKVTSKPARDDAYWIGSKIGVEVEHRKFQTPTGIYVLSGITNAFNNKTGWWLSKEGCTAAMYCFSTDCSFDKGAEMEVQYQLKSINGYIGIFNHRFCKQKEA